jgi:hypothetical protein
MSHSALASEVKPTLGDHLRRVESATRRCVLLLHKIQLLDGLLACGITDDDRQELLLVVISTRELAASLRAACAPVRVGFDHIPGLRVALADALSAVVHRAEDSVVDAVAVVDEHAADWLARARDEASAARSGWSGSRQRLDAALRESAEHRDNRLARLREEVEERYTELRGASGRYAELLELIVDGAGDLLDLALEPAPEDDGQAARDMDRLRAAFRQPSKTYRPARYQDAYCYRPPAGRAPLPHPPAPQPRKR